MFLHTELFESRVLFPDLHLSRVQEGSVHFFHTEFLVCAAKWNAEKSAVFKCSSEGGFLPDPPCGSKPIGCRAVSASEHSSAAQWTKEDLSFLNTYIMSAAHVLADNTLRVWHAETYWQSSG